jgi:hypothetical protein
MGPSDVPRCSCKFCSCEVCGRELCSHEPFGIQRAAVEVFASVPVSMLAWFVWHLQPLRSLTLRRLAAAGPLAAPPASGSLSESHRQALARAMQAFPPFPHRPSLRRCIQQCLGARGNDRALLPGHDARGLRLRNNNQNSCRTAGEDSRRNQAQHEVNQETHRIYRKRRARNSHRICERGRRRPITASPASSP